MLFKALTLPDQRPLQDYTSLLVPLTVLCSKLVDPTELAVAVLAADVSHHMPAGKHHSVLHLAILQVHYLWGLGHRHAYNLKELDIEFLKSRAYNAFYD